MTKEKLHNPGLRFGALIVFALMGIAFPWFLLISAFIGYGLYNDIKNPRDVIDEWYARRWTTTEDHPEWRNDFKMFCDSVAETTFLDAMIEAHHLKPSKGLLVGNGLVLDLQREIQPYRADFVANKEWVIEIDGAAFHSSPEAVAHDKKRDEFMVATGYKVLRIPAKVVFNEPNEALKRVDEFLGRVGVPRATVRAQPIPKTIVASILTVQKDEQIEVARPKPIVTPVAKPKITIEQMIAALKEKQQKDDSWRELYLDRDEIELARWQDDDFKDMLAEERALKTREPDSKEEPPSA